MHFRIKLDDGKITRAEEIVSIDQDFEGVYVHLPYRHTYGTFTEDYLLNNSTYKLSQCLETLKRHYSVHAAASLDNPNPKANLLAFKHNLMNRIFGLEQKDLPLDESKISKLESVAILYDIIDEGHYSPL